MEIIVAALVLLALALASMRFGVDSRSGRDWSVGALLQADWKGERSADANRTAADAYRTAR